ncbi:MAG: hypothetical protein GX640_13480 [Fibrobacter sp.]|nr:hypothetical protein [Fibrobacter sp.]
MNQLTNRFKKFKWLLPAMVVFPVILIVAGCSMLKGNYLYVEGKGDMALVSFSIDRRIAHESDSTPNDGPPLIESAEVKQAWWDYHKQAINIMYQQFIDHFSTMFPGTNLLSHEKISTNETYRTITQYKPKMVLGKDIGLGWSQINAEGLNWVSGYDKAKLDNLCETLNVNLAMTVEFKARWKVDSTYERPHGILMQQVNLGHMLLDASVFLHEKGKGMVWSGNFRNMGAENLVELEWSSGEPPEMNKSDFPEQLQSALLKIYPKIIEEVKRGKAAITQGS